MKLNLQIEKCKQDLDEILSALSCFQDEDFNGNNGEEYLWECAEGFECNQDYVLDLLEKEYKNKDIQDVFNVESLCQDYFEHFMGEDCYYNEFTLNVDVEDDNVIIACAWTCGD